MLVLLDYILRFSLRQIMLIGIKRYSYQSIVDQILSRLNNLYNTDEYISTQYPMRLSDNLVAEYYNLVDNQTLISFSLPQKDGKAYIENFDLSCLDFLKPYLRYITRYSKVENFHSVAHFKNGKVTGFNFVLNIYYPYHPRKYDDYIELSITTDIEFKLVKIVRKLCTYSVDKFFSKHLIKNDVSFDDEMKLVMLKIQSQNEEINRLVPEINTPSGYDLNTDDFNSRLLLVAMMET